MSREVFECRACHRKVVEIVERLRGAHGPVAVRDGVDGDLVQPGSKGPPRVLVSGHGLQSLHEDLVCRLLLEKKKKTEFLTLYTVDSRAVLDGIGDASYHSLDAVTHYS